MYRHMSHAIRALVLVCISAGIAIAQAPVAQIRIDPISPRMIDEQALGDSARVTTGLPTVVVGYRVYLSAMANDPESHKSENIAGAEWTLEAVPDSSALSIGALASTNETSFVPDVEGSYQVGLVVTDDSSNVSDKALLWITAAKFVGVGTIGGTTPDISKGQCAACHADKAAGWQTTSHSTFLAERAADVTTGGYYAERCIQCHSVGYDTLYATGGLDQSSGFAFPDTFDTAAYDSIVTNHPEQAAYFNIQCENCHGPGSQHRGARDKNQISDSFSAGVCASCHDAPTHHVKVVEWDASAHATYKDITAGGHASGSSCTRCHTAQGFVEETIDGGAAATYDNPDPITCTACHDPHDGSAEHNLRRGSVTEACTGCHTLRLSGYSGLHHSHQGSMLEGKDGDELPGYEYPNSAHSGIEEKCATCHMADAPSGVDGTIVGGHTFKIVGIDTTGGDHEVLNDTGCISCHGNVSLDFVELSQNKIHKLLDSLNAMLPTYPSDFLGFKAGEPVFNADSLTEAERVAAYNWRFVNNDGSFGVHNNAYATALLKSSIAELWATRAAGDLVAVEDVPNDQGKMVRVLWNAFAAENAAQKPITEYGVWRMNDDGEWDFVGSAPATGLNRYGLDVATLYDSTADDGAVWTTFRVSASTTDPQTTYWSNEVSGYSIDNLEPSVPGTPKYAEGKIAWAPSPEADVRYYAVFRTDLNGQFGTDVFATTVDTALAIERANFRYGIAAVDFAGNMSDKAVIDVDYTTINENRPVPATTALLGNAPNPFNPSTRISYQLHEDARVSLVVYNALGQQVRTLISGTMTAGVHAVNWDGLDDNGMHVSSGAYLYVLTTDTGHRDVRRMLLVR